MSSSVIAVRGGGKVDTFPTADCAGSSATMSDHICIPQAMTDGGGIMDKKNVVARWFTCAPYLMSVLRIVAGFLLVQFGTAKLFAFPAAIMPGGQTASLASLPGVAGVLEAFGGALLLVGLFTRPIAFLLSGEMAFVYFIGHAPRGFWPVLNNGHPAVLFCFVWLYISAAGAGPWSLDARLRGVRAWRTGIVPRTTSTAR